MQTIRRTLLFFLATCFAVASLPAVAQTLIDTVRVGREPNWVAINSATNKIYVPNNLSSNVTVIDGATDSTATVPAGGEPVMAAVNTVTNEIYVANSTTNTVTVIDGSTLQTSTVPVGYEPVALAVNPVTNKIYVVNNTSNNVTVIDGATNNTTTVSVGEFPSGVAVNPVTNKIYVGTASGDTVTVIDGATLVTTTVVAGQGPWAVAVNSMTNKIYVADNLDATVTVIDGITLSTTTVPVGSFPFAVAVNALTNKIFVTNTNNNLLGTVTVIDGLTNSTTTVPVGHFPLVATVDELTNKIYVPNACGNDQGCISNGTVTVIDGATLSTTTLAVGNYPTVAAVNPVTNRIYVANFCYTCGLGADGTVSVIDGTPPTALQFVAVTPCRVVDTRPLYGGGGPIPGGTHQDFPISGAPRCGIPASAAAYSLNVTVVPQGYLSYLTVWPTGQPQPSVSTLNSLDGRIKANAAIVPAGASGDVSVYATDTTNVILDIDGYFAPVSGSTLAFYTLPPCRVADTRQDTFPPGLGSPYLTGRQERPFPILNATACNIPSSAAAYSLNFTVVPHGPLGYLTVWSTGGSRPNVSTLNDIPGQNIANAAIVVAGASGEVSVYPTNDTDLVIDINGYFAPAGLGGLSLYGVRPCRVIDTRKVGGGQPFSGTLTPPVDVVDTGCGTSSLAQAYVFNATVVPQGALSYLTLWPDGTGQPLVSTLNAQDGSISSNMAIVSTTNGTVDAYASGITQLILDISSYFAP